MRSLATPSRRLPGSLRVWLLAATLTQAALSMASTAVGGGLAAPARPPLSDRTVATDSEPGEVENRAVAASLFATPTTRDHIGRVLVPVMINGRGPFRFIVDTGANRSTISPQLVRTLGLKREEGSVVVNGITGAAPTFFVTVDRLQAGDMTIDGTALPVVWAPVMAGADGILGAAGLSEKSLMIDFQRNRVEIARRVEAFLRVQSIRIHALSLSHGLIAVDAIMGRTHVTAIIDTGAERTLGNLALRNALKVHRPRGVVTMTSVYGATEEIEPGEIELAPSIAIESLHIIDVAVVYGDFHIFDVWGLKDSPAMIIGMDVLGTVASLSIDFKNQNIYVASVREGGTPFSTRGGALSESMQKR